MINKKLYSIKWIKVFSMMLAMVLSAGMLSACGNIPDSNGSVKSEDGRSYGGLVEEELGKTVHTVFFDLTVNSAKKCTTYQFQDGLYISDQGNTYLEVEVTVTNTYDKDLPMSISDFTLDFSGNDSEEPITGFGRTEVGKEEYMDNIFTLGEGETITKTILYIAPDRAEYLLCYKEYYEDKFEGDSYEISMIPEELEPAVTREETTEAVNEEITTEMSDAEGETSGESGVSSEASEGSSDTSNSDSQPQGDENTETTPGDDTGIIEQ